MTYEELKAQDDWYRSFPDWGDDNEIILDNIRARLKAYASRHFFKMLTDIDILHTPFLQHKLAILSFMKTIIPAILLTSSILLQISWLRS